MGKEPLHSRISRWIAYHLPKHVARWAYLRIVDEAIEAYADAGIKDISDMRCDDPTYIWS